MFDHVGTGVSSREESERFYDTVLGAIGIEKTHDSPGIAGWGEFLISAREPTTGLHVAFAARSEDDVRAFWEAGTAAGFTSDGDPALRPHYRPDYYGAFLLAPDGNSVEAVHHGGVNHDHNIDHMWIRTSEFGATVEFYKRLSEYTGYPPLWRHDGRVHFGEMGDHFAIVDETPATQNLHLAFTTTSNDVVDAFHAAALAAGYRDNGAPGERPRYHDGYYAAFVFDPAGTNVEVVNHNRY
jgi:catechol 2,3-dioxygenase-like lactoylglutathione lyase family enzyme